MTSLEQAIARGKLEYLEKYKAGKIEDLDYVSRWLGYKIEFLDNRKCARVYSPTGVLEVAVKSDYNK